MEKEAKKQQQRVGCRSEPDFLLQWGNTKRLRCVKIQVKDDATEKTTIRVDRRVVRADKESAVVLLRPSPFVGEHHRLLRNSENSGAMKAQNRVHTPSPEKAEERYPQAKINNSSNNNNNNNNNININNNNRGGNGGVSVSSETVQEKKGSSGNEAAAWPKFMITLTSKEKEEDFMAIKGSKLPQRPKKRAKFIQRSLNLVSPGSWLCDLTLERYEVREKKISRKRPRGLKAMGNMDSDSE